MQLGSNRFYKNVLDVDDHWCDNQRDIYIFEANLKIMYLAEGFYYYSI